MGVPQGDRKLLESAVAESLLSSRIPARFALYSQRWHTTSDLDVVPLEPEGNRLILVSNNNRCGSQGVD